MFYFESINNKKVLKSSLLSGVEHFFTTKETLEKQEICTHLNIKEQNLIHPNQTHGANIEIVNKKQEYPDTDALILDDTNKAIYLNFADCTPVILYDCKNNIVSVVHGGWRSTAQKIAPKTVIKMQQTYGTNPKDIKAAIFPCICFDCFQTSPEAIKALSQSIDNTEGLFSKMYADLKGINKRQLEQTGVKDIDVSPYCTCCDNDLFFSYRKENKTAKRNSLVAKLICP